MTGLSSSYSIQATTPVQSRLVVSKPFWNNDLLLVLKSVVYLLTAAKAINEAIANKQIMLVVKT